VRVERLSATVLRVSSWYNEPMSETTDHLAAVSSAAAKFRRAEQARDKARAALLDAIRAAETAQLRPAAIIEASGLPRATYYRSLKGSQ
jgi:hypothetical protein